MLVMNMVGLTFNLVCMGFLVFLITLYFSKKSMRSTDSMIYRYVILCNFFLLLFEILFVVCAYFFPTNLFLIGMMKRTSLFFVLLFFLSTAYYVASVATEAKRREAVNVKKEDLEFKLILLTIFVVGFLQYKLPIELIEGGNKYISYATGIGANLLALLFMAILAVIILPIIYINRKEIDRKKFLLLFLLLYLRL